MDINKKELKEILDDCIDRINDLGKEKGEVKITLKKYHDLLYYQKRYEEYGDKIDKIDKIVCRILEQDCDVNEYPYNNIFDIRKIICD